MDVWMNSFREMVLFYYSNSDALKKMLKYGIGEPNERDTVQQYFSKFYYYAKNGMQKDFKGLAVLTDKCREIIDRYTVLSEQ